MPLAIPPAIAAPAPAPVDAPLATRLERELLGTTSATATLERWCAERGLAMPAKVIAVVVHGKAKPLSLAQRTRLMLGPHDRLGYRHVRLVCGGRTLSEADNWYVASRLPAAIEAALSTSDAPFGKLVAPLGVTRRTLGIERLWRPGAPVPAELLRQHAVVIDRTGQPLAEVVEHYSSALVAPVRAP